MLMVDCTTAATRCGNVAEGLLVTAIRRMERRLRSILGVRCRSREHGHHRRYPDWQWSEEQGWVTGSLSAAQ
jgi:hypothetical protein